MRGRHYPGGKEAWLFRRFEERALKIRRRYDDITHKDVDGLPSLPSKKPAWYTVLVD